MQNSTWDEVILDPEIKRTLADDIEGFFDRKQLYNEFAVP